MNETDYQSYYEQLTDDQLRLVLADKQDLLPEAVAVLDREVKRRNLVQPSRRIGSPCQRQISQFAVWKITRNITSWPREGDSPTDSRFRSRSHRLSLDWHSRNESLRTQMVSRCSPGPGAWLSSCMPGVFRFVGFVFGAHNVVKASAEVEIVSIAGSQGVHRWIRRSPYGCTIALYPSFSSRAHMRLASSCVANGPMRT